MISQGDVRISSSKVVDDVDMSARKKFGKESYVKKRKRKVRKWQWKVAGRTDVTSS